MHAPPPVQFVGDELHCMQPVPMEHDRQAASSVVQPTFLPSQIAPHILWIQKPCSYERLIDHTESDCMTSWAHATREHFC